MHDRPFYTPKLSCATFLHSFFRTRIFASGDFFCGFFYSLFIYLLPALRGPEIRCGLFISELTAIVAKLQSKYGALVAWCIVHGSRSHDAGIRTRDSEIPVRCSSLSHHILNPLPRSSLAPCDSLTCPCRNACRVPFTCHAAFTLC
jgi:hypothetical protein